MRKKACTYAILLLVAAFLAACGSEEPSRSKQGGLYSVDPLFREFYSFLGGEEVLGGAISTLKEIDSTRIQYTNAGLMVFDTQAQANQLFHLAPLGYELGVSEPAVPEPPPGTGVYIEGHIIHPDFVPLYARLGGTRFIGKPLTEVHYNPEKRRYEQYFENLGFYRLEGEAPGTAHLLSYGAWACHQDCRSDPPSLSIVESQPQVEFPFSAAVETLGSDFTGFPISPAYLSADGKVEQIFENVVLIVDFREPAVVFIRGILRTLGVLPDPPSPPAAIPGTAFYALQPDRGYNIPLPILEYINNHGGLAVSGPPISEAESQSGQVMRQCFENLCVDYEPGVSVRPVQMGYNYKRMFFNATSPGSPAPGQNVDLQLQVWEKYPMIASSQQQEIGVAVLQNRMPVAKIEPVLLLTLPDGTQQRFTFPFTGDDGKALLRLPPLEATNGTLIPYEVCATRQVNRNFCVRDSYLIWNNP